MSVFKFLGELFLFKQQEKEGILHTAVPMPRTALQLDYLQQQNTVTEPL